LKNIFVRKYLEKKAAEKAIEKAQSAREDAGEIAYKPDVNESKIEPAEVVTAAPKDMKGSANGVPRSAADSKAKSMEAKKQAGLLGKTVKSSKKEKNFDEIFALDNDGDNIEQRPAFSTGHNSRTSKKTRPREVAVPYSKLRKDRFYDWPPDPTVSRATPVPGPWLMSEQMEDGMNGEWHMQPEAQAIPKGSSGLPPDLENLRRRYVAEQQQQQGQPQSASGY
jgi:hypothetical protein